TCIESEMRQEPVTILALKIPKNGKPNFLRILEHFTPVHRSSTMVVNTHASVSCRSGVPEVIQKTGREGTDDEDRGLVSEERSDRPIEKARIIRIAKTNIIYEVAVAYVFIVTLAVFPPITASVQPTNPNLHPLLFTSIHFLTFGLGDFPIINSDFLFFLILFAFGLSNGYVS
ncbi:hypothetical protein MPER_03996, partial [Moniliophthora perniciosa FA553]